MFNGSFLSMILIEGTVNGTSALLLYIFSCLFLTYSKTIRINSCHNFWESCVPNKLQFLALRTDLN